MRKGHYRYIRKSSLGTYNFGGIGFASREINRKNAQYKTEHTIANITPDTLARRKAMALIDELQSIDNIDWKYYGEPSTYTRDKICYKINVGIYDELLSQEGIFNDWEILAYALYKPEEGNSSIKSTGTWDKTAQEINEIKRKGNLTNQKEIELMLKRVNSRVEYYNEKANQTKILSKLFIWGLVILFIFIVWIAIIR